MLVWTKMAKEYPTLATPRPCTILEVIHTVYETRYKVAWQGGGVSGYLLARDFEFVEVPV
jgi:hypothetical protein